MSKQPRAGRRRKLVPRARRALARRLDPVSAEDALRRSRRGLQDGRLTAEEERLVARLAESWLERVGPDAPKRTTAATARAFERLWQPRAQPVPEPAPVVTAAIRDQFHRLYYHVSQRTWKDTWYRGIRTYKCPTDMWVYQELVDELRPGLVVETGTFRGGSALFLADRLEIAAHGEVVTIDVDVQPDRPQHPRLTYLTGSSVSEEVLEQVRGRVPADAPVLVILDSDHSASHVLAELNAYAPLVTEGSYLIVEDTNVNGHPAAPDHGPGPFEAVQEFLRSNGAFAVDPRCERYFLTQNPSGYLRRVRGVTAS